MTSRATLLLVALRANLLQATWNFERQQGAGLGVRARAGARSAVSRTRELRLARLAEHTAYFNTQPTLASLALGAAVRARGAACGGDGPDAASMARAQGRARFDAGRRSVTGCSGSRCARSRRPSACCWRSPSPQRRGARWRCGALYALPHLRCASRRAAGATTAARRCWPARCATGFERAVRCSPMPAASCSACCVAHGRWRPEANCARSRYSPRSLAAWAWACSSAQRARPSPTAVGTGARRAGPRLAAWTRQG